VSDIRAFVAEVMRELAVRAPFDDPLYAVRWGGDITAVVAGDDAPAKLRLACRLISLGLLELDDAPPGELAQCSGSCHQGQSSVH
jgi:hypothetical protein